MMKKRLFAAVLAVCLMGGLLPVSALADEQGPNDWWMYLPYPTETPGDKTPEEQKREQDGQILWYAWLASKYSTMKFTDVPEDSWFYPGVRYVWQSGLMSGVSDDSFAPNEPTTCAMAWTVLARLSGVSTQAVPGTEWYEPGLAWALKQQLIDGSPDPMGRATREYLVDMLWKRAGSPLDRADLSGFSDWKQVSPYAENAMRWAVANGLLQGDNGRLSPQGGVTRAELAALVMRYQQLEGKVK